MVTVNLLTTSHKATVILASLVLIDGVIVALVQGTATIMDALDLFNQTSYAQAGLGGLILEIIMVLYHLVSEQ